MTWNTFHFSPAGSLQLVFISIIETHLLFYQYTCLRLDYLQALHVPPYFTYLMLMPYWLLIPVGFCPGYNWGRWSASPMQRCNMDTLGMISAVSLFQGENDTYLGLSPESWLTKLFLFQRCSLREVPLYSYSLTPMHENLGMRPLYLRLPCVTYPCGSREMC